MSHNSQLPATDSAGTFRLSERSKARSLCPQQRWKLAEIPFLTKSRAAPGPFHRQLATPDSFQGAFLCTCSQGGFLDFKNEEYVVFYLLSGQGSAVSCSCYFGVSVHRGELQLLSLGPIYLLPEGVS